MAEMGPEMFKIPLFSPGGQNMQLRNESHEIKKVSPHPQRQNETVKIYSFFSVRKSSEMAEMCQKMSKFNFFTSGKCGPKARH